MRNLQNWVNIETVTSYDGVRVFVQDQDEFYLGADVWRKLRRIGKVVIRGNDLFMQQSEFAKLQAADVR
jgi:hypothetical protein